MGKQRQSRKSVLTGDQIDLEFPLTVSDRYEIDSIALSKLVSQFGLLNATHERQQGSVILSGRYFRVHKASKELRQILNAPYEYD